MITQLIRRVNGQPTKWAVTLAHETRHERTSRRPSCSGAGVWRRSSREEWLAGGSPDHPQSCIDPPWRHPRMELSLLSSTTHRWRGADEMSGDPRLRRRGLAASPAPQRDERERRRECPRPPARCTERGAPLVALSGAGRREPST